jgi:hypothetical protein
MNSMDQSISLEVARAAFMAIIYVVRERAAAAAHAPPSRVSDMHDSAKDACATPHTDTGDVGVSCAQPPDRFARNAAVTFDEAAHVYYVDGRRIDTSVTTFIHSFFEHFDAPRICRLMIRGRAFMSKPEHAQYGALPIWRDSAGARLDSWREGARLLDDEDFVVKCITDKWQKGGADAAALGTRMHAHIESYLNDEPVTDDSREFEYFLRYNEKMRRAGYIPYRMETRVYDESLSLAGSVDMMWTRPEHLGARPLKVLVVDWKRSKEIKREAYRNKRGRGICCNIPDCNYYHYTLQLNIYRHLLEDLYDIEVEGMGLVVLYPENPDYLEIPIDRIDISEMMRERRQIVSEWRGGTRHCAMR